MKTDSSKLNLDQLLATLEHSGRDARRQQALSDMIDRMDNADTAKATPRHKPLWWVVRISAAACLLFFIATAARIWLIPTGDSSPMIAEATLPAPVPAKADSAVITPSVTPRPTPIRHTHRPASAATAPATDEAQPIVEEVALAEEVLVLAEALPSADQPATAAPDMPVEVADTLPQAITPSTEALAMAEPTEKVSVVEPTTRNKPSLLDFFRRSEPSEMEGVALSFRIL